MTSNAQQFTSFGYIIPDNNFVQVPGGLLHFYEVGTVTPVIVYADDALSVELSNPVVADGNGLFPSIYLPPASYTIVGADANDVPLWTNEDYTVQDVPVLNSNFFQLINGQYYPIIAPNLQTGTGYTLLDSDRASLISFDNNAGGTVTFPAPTIDTFLEGWYVYISNNSTNVYTLTSSVDINGTANYVLSPGTFTLVVSNGSTYFAAASSTPLNQIFTKSGGTLTVTTNTITIGSFSQYLIDTSTGAQTVSTINGGIDRALLLLQVNSASNAATIVGGATIKLTGNGTCILKQLSDNILLEWDNTNSWWSEISRSTAVPIPPKTRITYQLANNTASGTFTGSAWTTSILNTTIYDDIGINLSTNQIVGLPQGTYEVYANACFGSTNLGNSIGRIRLFNITDSAEIANTVSSSMVSNVNANNITIQPIINHARFTISATKTITLQYYTGGTTAAAATNTGDVEIYADLVIAKIG